MMGKFNYRDCSCFGRKPTTLPSSSSELRIQSNARPSNAPESTRPPTSNSPPSDPVPSSAPTTPTASRHTTITAAPAINPILSTTSVFGPGTSSSPGINASSATLAGPALHSAPILLAPGLQNSLLPATKALPAFLKALQSHIDTLSPEEQRAFTNPNQLTSENLLAEIQKLDDSHKQQSFSRHDRLKNMLDMMKQGMGTLSAVIGGVSGIVSLVQGAVKFVVELGVRFVSFFTRLTSMMEHLASHLGYLNKWATTFPHSVNVQEALCQFYVDLIKFCQEARKVFVDGDGKDIRWISFRVFLRITWGPFETKFDDIRGRLDNRMLVVSRTAIATEQERTHAESQRRSQDEVVEERRKLLAWLGGLSGLNFDADHERIFDKWLVGTGDWLLQSPEFTRWVDKQESSLLWCFGNPGAVLASRVLDQISEDYALDDRTGIVFIYFNFQVPESQIYDKVLATLVKQLCRRRNGFPSQLQGPYRSSNTPTSKELLAQFIELSKTFDQVFLTIDALDECQPRKAILAFISGLSRETSCRVKVFVTSRPERDIEVEFTKSNFPTVRIEAKKVDEDIKVFVNYEVTTRTGPDNRCTIDNQLQRDIMEALCSRSGGMFLWVSFQLDDIYEQPSVGDIRKILASLPVDMHATYIRILRLIGEQHQSLRDIVKRVLVWVVSAGRPLSHEELAVAAAITPESRNLSDICGKYLPNTVIEACRNFITVDADEVRFVHFTVQEFLTSSLSSDALKSEPGALQLHQHYQVIPNDAHAILVKTFVQFMLFEDIKDFAPGEYPTAVWKLQRYIFEYFDHHIRALELQPDAIQEIVELLSSGPTTNAVSLCLALHLVHIFEIPRVFALPTQDSLRYPKLLSHAAALGKVSVIRTFYDSGYKVDIPDREGVRPLYYASLHANLELVRYLLGYEAALDASGGYYGNALQAAVVGGNSDIVELLLHNGAYPNVVDGKYGTALQAAAVDGNSDIVELLLRSGASPNTVGGKYGTALQAAVVGGNADIVRMLNDVAQNRRPYVRSRFKIR